MPTTRVPSSNATKMRNPLKLAGVPQTRQQISAVSGPKFTTLWVHVEEILLFNKFFFRLSIRALVAKIWPDKVVWWCADGEFLGIFLRPAFSASHVQHVSDLHHKVELWPHHVWKYGRHPICDGWEEARKKEEEDRQKKKPQDKNIMACPIPQGGHN